MRVTPPRATGGSPPGAWPAAVLVMSLALALMALVSPSPPAAAATAASISAVHFAGTKAAPSVTVDGSNFGASPPAPTRLGSPCEAAMPGNFYGSALNVRDLTGRWKAGTYSGWCI